MEGTGKPTDEIKKPGIAAGWYSSEGNFALVFDQNKNQKGIRKAHIKSL